MPPATPEMAVTKIATDLALQGAGWAVAVVLGFALVYLYRAMEKKDALILSVVSDVKAAIQASTAASTANAMALEGLRSVMEARGQVMEGISRQIEGVARSVDQGDERTRERLTEILQRMPSGGR